MRQSFLLFLLGLLCTGVQAQQRVPQLLVFHPETKKPVPLKITELNCEVEITGNRVNTTFYFTFFNEFNRDLEGKLEFPLGEGENVVRFALEINGNLREGVMVDKNKGQQAFEEIEHKNVDPGLLEKTSGNNYRARVYPVPHLGSKRLAIGYEKILSPTENEDMLVTIPLVMGQKIGKFKIRVTVFNEEEQPRQGNDAGVNMTFEKWENAFVAQKEIDDFEADKILKFTVPRKGIKEQVFVEKMTETSSKDFYFSTTVYPHYIPTPKAHPKTIAVYWDASLSGKNRNTEKELALLKTYLEKLREVQVKIYAFNIDLGYRNVIDVKNGKADAVIEAIRNIPFDGATQMGILDFSAKTCNEILLFSDGMTTLGKEKIKTGTIPVYAIVSGASANYDQLRYLSTITGGSLVNLTEKETPLALEELEHLPYRLLACKGPVREVYSDLSATSQHAFTVSGISSSPNTELELQFGYGDSVFSTQKIKLQDQFMVTGNRTERTWALQKLNRLQLLPEENKTTIVAHATHYSVVSPFTSLIVLENVSDYVQYNIEPPAELRQEYHVLLDKKLADEDKIKKSHLDEVAAAYDQKLQWWKVNYGDTIRKVEEAIRRKKLEEKLTKDLSVLDSMRSALQTRLDSVNEAREDVQWRLDSLHAPPGTIMARKLKFSQNAYDIKTVNESVKYVMAESHAMRNEMQSEIMAVQVAKKADGFDFSDPQKREKNRDQINISEWNPKAPYLDELKQSTDAELYKTYLRLRENYLGSVSFYLDAADVFLSRNREKEAVLVLSNLAELKNECHTFMRILGHRYLQIGQVDYSVDMFKRVLKLRREEPQSYRDLGNALAMNKQYQAAIDTLYRVVLTDWNNRFPEFENIALTEMNEIITTCGQALNTTYMDNRLLKATPAEVRIVLNWDTDYCDIDLHVTDPIEEECFYGHALTKIGGRLSRDFTQGLGPEEFMAHYAMHGKYKIEINYFGQRSTEVLGPTTVMIQIYTHYGQPNQEVKEITRRLESEKERITIGEIEIK